MKRTPQINIKAHEVNSYSTHYTYLEYWKEFHVSISCLCTLLKTDDTNKLITVYLN